MNCPHPVSHVIRQGDNLYHLSRYYQTTVQQILAQNPETDPYNLKIGSTVMICPGDGFITQTNTNPPSCPNVSMQIGLINDMRLLWEQHVYWTRMLLISIAERLKEQNAVTNRILENPDDIASLFANYYNSGTAKTISQLLTEHLQIGASLITALRDGQTAAANDLNRRWYINADKMADAFSSINPYYSREHVRDMLYSHLDLTKQEVSARLGGNYPLDIEAFDKVEVEALSMADYFTLGLMQQFPQKFN